MQSEYKFNKQYGEAKIWFADGDSFSGSYVNNHKHGVWIITRADGTKV